MYLCQIISFNVRIPCGSEKTIGVGVMKVPLAKVIEFGGDPVNDIVWQYPDEDIPTGSTVIVDETHKALVVVNGQAADLLDPGPHVLDLPTLPLAGKLVRMAVGGDNPFPCRIFYISQVHQSNLLWGTQGGPIVLTDPLYNIFLHVMMHGSLYYAVTDPRKLLIKLVGFQQRFGAAEVTTKFRGLISSHVKDVISQIMIRGGLSFFMISANQMELSDVVKERLSAIFDEYGIGINYFNIETVEVPDEDFAELSSAKQRAAARLAEGYSWEQEREMLILEKFAGNQSAAASMLAMGCSFGQIARMAAGIGADIAGTDAAAVPPQMPVPDAEQSAPEAAPAAKVLLCKGCGAELSTGSRFCNLCGHKVEQDPVCPECGKALTPGSRFCNFCGARIG